MVTAAAMFRIAGTTLFWVVLAMVIYLIYKSPEHVSQFIAGAGHLFTKVGDGIETFVDDL
jgi:hypothetical protein